jgi:hypothetical protein
MTKIQPHTLSKEQAIALLSFVKRLARNTARMDYAKRAKQEKT